LAVNPATSVKINVPPSVSKFFEESARQFFQKGLPRQIFFWDDFRK
jgi:hypothetical protein